MFTKRFFKTKDEVEVTFEIDRPDVDSVEWVAEATGWEPVAMNRSKRGKGPHKLRIRLPKEAAVQFRYLLDRERWVNDADADATAPTPYSDASNCVIET